MTTLLERRWVDICRYDEVPMERGVRVLVGDVHIAVFRTHGEMKRQSTPPLTRCGRSRRARNPATGSLTS